jgi:hypothetical protein
MKNEEQPETKENEPDYVVTAEQLRNLRLLLVELANHIDTALPQVVKSSGQVSTSNWKTGYRASLHLLQFVEGMVGKIHTQSARHLYNAIRVEQEAKSKATSANKVSELLDIAKKKTKQHKRKTNE